MSLTLSHAPLSRGARPTVNYRIEGPDGLLFLEPFPRRVRAELSNETVLDTVRGMLLHESGHLPRLYAPRDDLRPGVLEPGSRTTHCPHKGDATHWSVRVGERVAVDAVWGYEDPLPEARWLAGLVSVYWDSMDTWYDEDEPVVGHLRDPYHRVDARRSSRHVVVRAGGETLADTRRPVVVSETGLPNRLYIDPADVRGDLLAPSATRTVCPYRGEATYRSLVLGDRRIDDAAWSYVEPLDGLTQIRGLLCFRGDGVETLVDGRPVPD